MEIFFESEVKVISQSNTYFVYGNVFSPYVPR